MTTDPPLARGRLTMTLVGFVGLWLVLDRTAAALGSLRGEAGFAVLGLVLLAALAVERVAFGQGPAQSLKALGFRAHKAASLVWAVAISAGLLTFYPLYSIIAGVQVGLLPKWPLLALGMFVQGGLAEEVVFRGYLFRHVRQGRSFWRAAFLAAIPFVGVHLFLFLTLDPYLALASILVSLSISFPLARLFDVSGGSVWPPVILHAVVQSSIKVVVVDEGAFTSMAVWWMALSVAAPWALFLISPGRRLTRQASQKP